MKKEAIKKGKPAAPGKTVVEEKFTLPGGRDVKVKVLDCRSRKKEPKVPKAAWGTKEFADEFEYFDAPKSLQTKVRKLLSEPLVDLIDFIELCRTKGARAVTFWRAVAKDPEINCIMSLSSRIAAVNAEMIFGALGIDLLTIVHELVPVHLKAKWHEKEALSSKKPTSKKKG